MRPLILLCLAAVAFSGFAAPTIFWASDPVGPDDTVLVCGDGFGEAPVVELRGFERLLSPGSLDPSWPADTIRPEVIHPSDQTLKFVIPADLAGPVYAFRVLGPDGPSAPWLLNLPTVYWVQGDQGTSASPGGWVRIFGRCISRPPAEPKVLLRGDGPGKPLKVAPTHSQWDITAEIPADTQPGEYALGLDSGYGPAVGGEELLRITVRVPEVWPQQVFNVMDFGASGDGQPQDDGAVRAALKEAEKNGGGVVYFPRGRYYIMGTLNIPTRTVLRGEAAKLSCLFWPDSDEAYTLVQGTHHFGLEDLTLYASNHLHCIAGEIGTPEAGHTFLRRVTVRADMYRGHLTQEQVADRMRAAMRLSTGGGDTVRLGGENVQITGCDLYGSGRSLYLLSAKGARVSNNVFYNGRWGWYCLDGSDGLILEDNVITSGDLMSTGGSLNCYSTARSQNVWYARNRLERAHGWDREAMTSDAGYGAFFGKAVEVGPDWLTLDDDPDWRRKKDWIGGGVFILDGKGMGQYRQIAKYDGRRVELDRPWGVPPDTNSTITITMLQHRYLFIDNSFEDVGIALQYYGTSIDHVASGNTSTRGGGFYNSGRWYRHFQPSWYCQFLDNVIDEGNCYRFGPNNSTNSGLSFIGSEGLQSQGGQAPLALCSVHRRNQLLNNAEMRFIGVSSEFPGLRDAVAEHNIIENSPRGVFMDDGCRGVLLRENTFTNVAEELVTPAMIAAKLEAQRAALIDLQDPVLALNFDESAGGNVSDQSGHNFAAVPTGTIEYESSLSGKAPRFDGSAYFIVRDRQMLKFPRITLAAWVWPDQIKGRWGVMAKRSRGAAAPYVLALRDGGISFEATDTEGKWSYNMTTKPVIVPGAWNHIAVTCEEGVGIRVYCNGQLAGEKQVTGKLVETDDILTIGYENWGGPDSKAGESGNFRGLIDEVRIWSRILAPGEITAQYDALKGQAAQDVERREKERAAAQELSKRFATEIVSAGGVDWRLVVADDFERADIGPDWKTLRGKWTVANGTLRCNDVSFLGLAKKVKAPVRIEYDARSQHPGDLTAFWGNERDGYQGGYFMGFASNGNTANKILRLGEDVASNEKPNATPGKWHHIIAQVIGNRVQLIVDGELVLEYTDPKPLTAPDMPGLIAWGAGEFDNVRIYSGQ